MKRRNYPQIYPRRVSFASTVKTYNGSSKNARPTPRQNIVYPYPLALPIPQSMPNRARPTPRRSILKRNTRTYPQIFKKRVSFAPNVNPGRRAQAPTIHGVWVPILTARR